MNQTILLNVIALIVSLNTVVSQTLPPTKRTNTSTWNLPQDTTLPSNATRTNPSTA